ncbi:MAG: NAD(P)H-dependent glycerol-3-phosphate dehydrogenase [Melioribacteraceae bacterium]|nr:NAD(P)H-dependent glycerol-3-phosphate dehydrogenase [Melioribacteraceae bacterium]
MKISVLGAGGWGTALAILLHFNGHKVTLWEFDKRYAKSLKRSRKNKLYLPGVDLPDELNITHSLDEAVQKQNMVVIAVPSQFVRSVLSSVKKIDFSDVTFVSVSKGIEKGTLMTVEEVIKDEFPNINDEHFGVLSGPSHAEEVSRRIPTTVVAASRSDDTARRIQSAFMCSYFRVYSSNDIIGVELGGALKNIFAIGAGIIDGAKFGDNTKAAIMTRGVSELARLGVTLGAKKDTFYGLSGMGDLIVTCSSKHSRNRYVGEQIGMGHKLKNIIKKMDMVAEGVETTRSAYELAKIKSIDTPIINAIYSILYEDKDPILSTYELMERAMKPE